MSRTRDSDSEIAYHAFADLFAAPAHSAVFSSKMKGVRGVGPRRVWDPGQNLCGSVSLLKAEVANT